jgi:hypothetical protein
VIDVADATVTDEHAAPPTVTEAPDENPEPVIVNAVPPATGPDDGDTPVTVGGAETVMVPAT